MSRKPHSGKDPPQLPKMNRSTLKVVPPDSPVTEFPRNAAQSTMGHMDVEGFVDLQRAGRGSGQQPQVDLARKLSKADLKLKQSQLQLSQHQVVQPHQQNQYGLPPVPQIGEIKVFNRSQFLEAMYKLRQQQQQQSLQQQLETASPVQHLPDPLPALQQQPALKKPTWRQDKVTPSDQGKAFNAEDLTFPEFQGDVDVGFDCLKLKDSATKPHKLYAQPSDTFQEGKVQLCSKKGCEDFLLHIDKLRGTTGVLLNDRFKPDGDRYEDRAHYITIKELGAGSFGTVDLCVDSDSQQQFVRKKLKKASVNPTEVSVPVKVPHDNMTHVYGIISNPDSIELLIEYAGIALNRYVAKHLDLWKSEKQMWNLVRQGFRALAHLDKYGITHLDIKPENLCILTKDDGNLVLKLTDFGSARTPQESLKFVGMTPEYLAPEIAKLVLQLRFKAENFNYGLSEKDVTGKVDVFAFALVIMYIYKGYHILQKLITKGQTSYANILPEQQQLLQTQLLVQLASDNTFITNLIPDECSLDMRDLISDLVQHDHHGRPTASAALHRVERYVKTESDRQGEVLRSLEMNYFGVTFPESTPKYSPVGRNLPELAEQCMEVDSGPVRHATKDLLRKKIANPYVSGKGFKGQGKGFKGQGKGRSYTEAGRSSTETRPSQYRGRPVASKVMDFPMTPVEEVMKLRLCIEEQPVYGVTDSHAPIAQASMETECTNDCEFIADNAPMANIQACPIPQFQQINPFPQTVQAYAQASNVQDVDLRRRVSSPQTVQSLRPQTLQTIGQAASQTTRPFTKRDMIKQQLVQLMLRANSTQLQQIIPESPVYQDCPAALMPNFDLLK